MSAPLTCRFTPSGNFSEHIQQELDGIAVPDDHAPRGMTIDVRGNGGGVWSIVSEGGSLRVSGGESENRPAGDRMRTCFGNSRLGLFASLFSPIRTEKVLRAML